jgi:tetratricopeptide (TPR) repeat protein
MLLGDIINVQPQMTLTARLVEVATGDVVASQRITGDTTDNIFTLVDKLTVEIKNDLSLPLAALQESDRMVADVTTHSPEAYRHYVEGVDLNHKLYTAEAVRSFEKALEYDSTFAMVYYYLSRLKDRDMIERALQYSDKASQKEQYYIRLQQASVSGDSEGYVELLEKMTDLYPDEKEILFYAGVYEYGQANYEASLRHFNLAVVVDPLYKLAYNQLAYIHNNMGNFDQAIWAINKYISLAPDEANPYDTRGDIYASNGSLDKALESFRIALEKKPDFGASLRSLGHCYLFKGLYDKADSCYRLLASHEDLNVAASGRLGLVYIPIRQGKFNLALRVLDEQMQLYREEAAKRGSEGESPTFRLLKALIYEEQQDFDAALEEIEIAVGYLENLPSPDSMSYRHHYARLLALQGNTERAEQILLDHKDYMNRHEFGLCYYQYGSASLEMLRNNTTLALQHLESAAAITSPAMEFLGRFMLGRAYLETDQMGKAVEVFEEQFKYFNGTRLYNGSRYVKMHYLLGLAYEQSRWFDKAVKQYEEFLDIWKDADPNIQEVEDARERLARLRQRS